MPELRFSDQLRQFLNTLQPGKEISLDDIRREMHINPADAVWDGLRSQMRNMATEKMVKPTGRKDGTYKILAKVSRVQVFGREKRGPVNLVFPRDFETMIELSFALDIVIREGDLILIAGRSNYGKTCLCMNFLAENIDYEPIIMGNEYTTIDNQASPRFVDRLEKMDWVNWVNGTGQEKFVLLPVFEDYADYIVKDKLNIIDWINLDVELYRISKVMEEIKRALGMGVAIIAIQKGEGLTAGRGGQFTKDFADVEMLLDAYGEYEIKLTIDKVKESQRRVTGRNFAFQIRDGVKITNFREIFKCKSCYGKGWKGSKPCDECNGTGFQS